MCVYVCMLRSRSVCALTQCKAGGEGEERSQKLSLEDESLHVITAVCLLEGRAFSLLQPRLWWRLGCDSR